nr:AAA family ATPase [Bacteroidota bacterium]
MTTKQKVKIKETVNQFVQKKGISKSDLATQLSISSATLSNIEHERWDMLKDEMLMKVWNIVKPVDWTLIRTSNYENIYELCHDARETTKMVGLIGYPGAGKTTALKEYYRRSPNTWYISGQKSMRPKRFFEKLLRQMGVMFSGTIYDMIERLAEELNHSPHSLLIIDEAGK